MCGGKVLELFQPTELRAMIVGNSNYNWEELEEVKLPSCTFFFCTGARIVQWSVMGVSLCQEMG